MILPLSEAKLNYPVEEVGQRTPKKQGDARTASNTCAELALAEEGGGMNNDDTHVCAMYGAIAHLVRNDTKSTISF